jgi:hypothetical protein
MLDFKPQPNYSGPTTTANSASEGRLKVDVNQKKKKKILKRYLNK